MKKIAVFILIALVLLCLTSCDLSGLFTKKTSTNSSGTTSTTTTESITDYGPDAKVVRAKLIESKWRRKYYDSSQGTYNHEDMSFTENTLTRKFYKEDNSFLSTYTYSEWNLDYILYANKVSNGTIIHYYSGRIVLNRGTYYTGYVIEYYPDDESVKINGNSYQKY